MTDTMETFSQRLLGENYVAESELVTTLLLMQTLQRPLLIEGEAGVGKTEVGKMMAKLNESELIRLQCYDGLDASTAVYEWNYTRQLLNIEIHKNTGSESTADTDLFDSEYLLQRPLLKAIQQNHSPVLLIDEIDRTDEAFEAFLLELLSDFQITIPEIGTIYATSKPMVILTSNGTRELSDALRRRCLYYYLEFPDFEKELRIIRLKLPGIHHKLAMQVAGFMQKIRQQNLRKQPGVAETLDWASALVSTDTEKLTSDNFVIESLRTCLLKTREDRRQLNDEALSELITTVS